MIILTHKRRFKIEIVKIKGCEIMRCFSFKINSSHQKIQGLHLNGMQNSDARFERLIGINTMIKAEFCGSTGTVRDAMKKIVASRTKLFSGIEEGT